MKKILLTILGLFLITNSALAMNSDYKKQYNQRECIAYWDKGNLILQGTHRPYSKIIVFTEDEKIIAQTNSDTRGNYSFQLGKTLDSGTEHKIIIRAYDLYDREIMSPDGEPDIIIKKILPGLQTEGVIIADDGTPLSGAIIDMYDQEGILLNRFYSNENGIFLISNAPKDAIIKIYGDGLVEEKIALEGKSQLTVKAKFDSNNPPKLISKEELIKELTTTEEISIVEQKKTGINWTIFIIITTTIVLGATFYLKMRKHKI